MLLPIEILLAEGGPPPSPFDLGGMLPFIAIIGIFWLIVIRPSAKQDKERRQRLNEIKRGDKVVLSGGILGRVSKVEDDIAMVEIADKVRVRVLKKDIVDLEDFARKQDDKKDEAKDTKDAKDSDAKKDDEDGDNDKSRKAG